MHRSAPDTAECRTQYRRHEGLPEPHVVALRTLARQRLKVVPKLMTPEAVHDKEIPIASHLDRERRHTTNGTRAAQRMPAPHTALLHLDF
jgi:hypothetical protein